VWGFGVLGLGPAPKPQNPKPQIPNPQSPIPNKMQCKLLNKINKLEILILSSDIKIKFFQKC